MKTRSALSWYGSDAGVAKTLGAMFDGISHVTIPFCGGLSILPHLKAKGIVANDLEEGAIDFYRLISGLCGKPRKKALVRLCKKTLSHPVELEDAIECLSCGATDPVERAWAYWALCWIGRGGAGGTAFKGKVAPSVRMDAVGGNNASRLKAVKGDLKAWAREFERCEFLCEDYSQVLSKVKDRVEHGIYVDPPWVNGGSRYSHPFTPPDHTHLRNLLDEFANARIVVRYDDCELIRELYGGWGIQEAVTRSQANSSVQEIWITKNRELS